MKKIIKLDGRYLKIDESNFVYNEYDATDFNDVGKIEIVDSDNRLYSVVHGKIDWVVIGISSSAVTLMSLHVLGNIQYAYPKIIKNEIQDIKYSASWEDSIVRHLCEFNKYNFLGDYKVEEEIRIPTAEEIESLPDNLRIASSLDGYSASYWTSDIYNSNDIWCVETSGILLYSDPRNLRGFRPVVTLSRETFNEMERDWSGRK